MTLRGEVMKGADAVRLTYQACDETRCLPPVTEQLAVHEEAPL